MLVNWKGESDDPGVLGHLAGEEVAAAFLRKDVGQEGANDIVIVMKSGLALMVRPPRGVLGTPSTGVVPPDALPDVIREHLKRVAERRVRTVRSQERLGVEEAQVSALPEWMRS